MFLILSLLVIVIIALLAARRSMRDFHDLPPKNWDYGVFLVKHPQQFSEELLLNMFKEASKEQLLLSFEKLLKGKKEALVIYGPRGFLQLYKNLNLLELEEYSNAPLERDVFCWEIVRKNTHHKPMKNTLKELQIKPEEQIWLQIVTQSFQARNHHVYLQATIRMAIVSPELSRRSEIARSIEGNFRETNNLTKKVSKKSSTALFNFYKERAIVAKEGTKFRMSPQEIVSLVR